MQMRSYSVFAVMVGLALSAGCTRDRSAQDREPAAKQAGREAYRASQDIKKGAREAAHEIREAGKEFRDGWGEAKRDRPPRRDDDRPSPTDQRKR